MFFFFKHTHTLPKLFGKTPLSGKCLRPSSYEAHALNTPPKAASYVAGLLLAGLE